MSDVTLWWIALGLGVVVLIVAVVLLHAFLKQVHRIEENASAIWRAGKEVAGNTSTTWQLDVTADKLDALIAETQRHEELLDTPAGRGPTP